MNSIWIIDLHVKCKSITHLEENIGENLPDPLNSSFLHSQQPPCSAKSMFSLNISLLITPFLTPPETLLAHSFCHYLCSLLPTLCPPNSLPAPSNTPIRASGSGYKEPLPHSNLPGVTVETTQAPPPILSFYYYWLIVVARDRVGESNSHMVADRSEGV